MVVVDDMAIPCGTIRLRGEGGAGGHQGLVDVERALGGARYPRCRVGIDGPGEQSWSDYVLGRHRPEQRPLVDAGIALAADAVEVWASEGLPAAMNRFNRPDRPESAGTPRPTRPDRPATPPDASSPGSAGRSPS